MLSSRSTPSSISIDLTTSIVETAHIKHRQRCAADRLRQCRRGVPGAIVYEIDMDIGTMAEIDAKVEAAIVADQKILADACIDQVDAVEGMLRACDLVAGFRCWGSRSPVGSMVGATLEDRIESLSRRCGLAAREYRASLGE